MSVLSEMNLTEAQIDQLLFEQRGVLEGTFKINAITNRIISILEELKNEIIEDEVETESLSVDDFPCLFLIDNDIAYSRLGSLTFYVMNEKGQFVYYYLDCMQLSPVEESIKIIPCTLKEIKTGDHFILDNSNKDLVGEYLYCRKKKN